MQNKPRLIPIIFKGTPRLKKALQSKAKVQNTTVSRLLNRAAMRLVNLKED